MAGRYHLTCLALCLTLVTAHIPMGYYDSAEPNSPIFVTKSSSPVLTRTQSRDRLDAVRRVLSNERIDAFIVPTADAHNSQYIAPADARRVWLSGLRGSSGTAVVTQDKALVWTDARYFTQFEAQVPHGSRIWLSEDASQAVNMAVESNVAIRVLATVSPVALMKVMKNDVELEVRIFNYKEKSLWDVGLNYGHGTGHGVGHFLNVHEGPAWILSSQAANDPGIRPKMVYSNEPGYYEVNEYGIRHEDLVETIEVTTSADHLQASGMVGNFDGRGAVGFYTISLAPHQTSCLDVNLLNDFELSYINSYHARVFSTLGPILRQRGLTDVLAWLEDECAPIQRSAAVWITATPLLLIVSVFTVFKA
ncbi:hypothetical protein O3G_MSEX014993 [Manduca sexta]|uniref:Uncharacterized protein n=1 Tax=Manduca sexta TaxID=7130 RepID=A0A921ZX63_MANSE|nr:hypothetical protein O3G_MSEX014993 [Manduca sexta]